MPMTCSLMPSARAFTSVAGLASLMFWKRKKRRIDGSHGFPRYRVRALRSLYPRWIVCLLLSGGVRENQQPSGCSDQCLEKVAAALRNQRMLASRQGSKLKLPKWRVSGPVIALCLTAWSGLAWAYRPFDGTDAAIAAPGELEIELQPAGRLHEGGNTSLVAPATVINYGLSEGWEAVLAGQGETALSPSGPTSLTSAGAFLKHVLQPGSLQDKTGRPSEAGSICRSQGRFTGYRGTPASQGDATSRVANVLAKLGKLQRR